MLAEVIQPKKKETIITGVIDSHPIITFRDVDKETNQVKVGWVFQLKTTQMIGYDFQDVVINISTVYDITKWDILKKGDRVDLSVLSTQNSSFTQDGKALKCNVTYRRGR